MKSSPLRNTNGISPRHGALRAYNGKGGPLNFFKKIVERGHPSNSSDEDRVVKGGSSWGVQKLGGLDVDAQGAQGDWSAVVALHERSQAFDAEMDALDRRLTALLADTTQIDSRLEEFKVAEGRAVAVKDVDTLPPKVRQALGVLTAMGRPEKVLEEVASRSTSGRATDVPEGVHPAHGTGHEILLQAFNWESWKGKNWWRTLAHSANDLAEMGFTAVWLPPPTDSVSPEGYLPRDLYDLDRSKYGNLNELKDCIAAFHETGIKVLADAVLNHRCAQHQDSDGSWTIYGGKLDWGRDAIVSNDKNFRGRGNHKSGDFFHAAPNIDHSNERVARDVAEWLKWLREDVGFDGFRFDFVRGFQGRFVKRYLEVSGSQFAVGEYWDSLGYDGPVPHYNQDQHRQRIVNWIQDAGCMACGFDVTLKGVLHAVFEKNEFWRLKDHQGKAPGLAGWLPKLAVLFLENHDTGSTQGHWRFPQHGLEPAYAYILTHPGTPSVFYDHLLDPHMKATLKTLIAIRKKAGVTCGSSLRIHTADNEKYAAEVEGVFSKIVVKIGFGHWSPNTVHGTNGAPASPINGESAPKKWIRVDSGHNWCVWEENAEYYE